MIKNMFDNIEFEERGLWPLYLNDSELRILKNILKTTKKSIKKAGLWSTDYHATDDDKCYILENILKKTNALCQIQATETQLDNNVCAYANLCDGFIYDAQLDDEDNLPF